MRSRRLPAVDPCGNQPTDGVIDPKIDEAVYRKLIADRRLGIEGIGIGTLGLERKWQVCLMGVDHHGIKTFNGGHQQVASIVEIVDAAAAIIDDEIVVEFGLSIFDRSGIGDGQQPTQHLHEAIRFRLAVVDVEGGIGRDGIVVATLGGAEGDTGLQ